ncbi:hypothetical protein [Methanoregula sp.]|jgi:hypothetical protein|uniref:hypothetical protein n=1 Tax=Methanoregula sp. TaxID=2052170 RepID=UPI003C14D1E2
MTQSAGEQKVLGVVSGLTHILAWTLLTLHIECRAECQAWPDCDIFIHFIGYEYKLQSRIIFKKISLIMVSALLSRNFYCAFSCQSNEKHKVILL